LLCFFYFCADMSKSALAAQHCVLEAAGLALAFVWMKTWQSVFASELRARLSGDSCPPWTLRRLGDIAIVQCAIQPTALFAVPLALVMTVPFGWTVAFYHNTTVLAESGHIRQAVKNAYRQAQMDQGQCIKILLILGLFSLLCFINIAVGMAEMPYLLKSLLGVETSFTRSGLASVLNTTFLVVAAGLSWVCVDLLVKAVFLLRCFYGQSVSTGEALRVELRRLRTANSLPLCGLAALLLISSATFGAEPAATPERPASVSAAELNRSIDTTLQGREFLWRLPREQIVRDDSQKGFVAKAFDAMLQASKEWYNNVSRWIGKLIDWVLDRQSNRRDLGGAGGSGTGWISSLRILLVVSIVLVAAVLGVLFYRMWKRRSRVDDALVNAQAQPAVPNLEDENVAASQLPEDGWLAMARDLINRGDFRLALRAFYLSGLAHLADRDLVSITRYKSNRDYEKELRRRARSLPELQNAFSENSLIFDCSWYGRHEVTDEVLARFQGNLERIRSC